MAENKRLAVPRELWRKAMPEAPERVIRALETLSDYYDDEEQRQDIITNDIYLSSGNGTAALAQIQSLESALQDLQLETSLAFALPVVPPEQDSYTAIYNFTQPLDEVLPAGSPDTQQAAQFIANSTPIEFTPSVIGTTTAGTGTYTYQIGSGQLIGNRFEFSISIGWTAHSGTGLIAVINLPYAARNQSNKLVALSVVAENLTYTGQLCAYMLPSETSIRLGQISSGAPLAGVTIDTSAALHITGSYEV